VVPVVVVVVLCIVLARTSLAPGGEWKTLMCSALNKARECVGGYRDDMACLVGAGGVGAGGVGAGGVGAVHRGARRSRFKGLLSL